MILYIKKIYCNKTIFIIFLATQILFSSFIFADDVCVVKNSNISLDEKIGQMLIIGFNGDKINSEITNYIKNYHIGGVVLFNKTIKGREPNIVSKTSLIDLNKNIQKLSKIPLFISVDQEGGFVNRINKDITNQENSPSFDSLGKENDLQKTYNESHKVALLLRELGINLNFSPSVDINLNPNNPIIAKYERSFGSSEEIVFKHANAYIKAHHDVGIITSLKHFPGHGSSNADSHKSFVDITNTFNPIEMMIYEKFISAGYGDMIMTAHVINKDYDEKYPASLSKAFTHNILREKFNFKGVIITDDLKMKAIEDNFSLEETIIAAINAGANILLYGNNLGVAENEFVEKVFSIVKNGLKNQSINQEMIDESYEKIINLKIKFNIISTCKIWHTLDK